MGFDTESEVGDKATMGPKADEFIDVYQEITNDAHRKAADLIGAPAFVWHQAFWKPRTEQNPPQKQRERIQEFLKDLHTHIGHIPGSSIEPARPIIEVEDDDRVRTFSFYFIWHHVRAKIRIENHTEYLTITSIIDASVDISGGNRSYKDVWRRISPDIYGKIESYIDKFNKGTNFLYGDKADLFEGGEDVHQFIYNSIWDAFFTEILQVKNYFDLEEGRTDPLRVRLGLKFADFRGFITCERYPEGDYESVDCGDIEESEERVAARRLARHAEECGGLKDWGVNLGEIQSPYHNVHEGARGQWHRTGYPGSAWARYRINNLWPFLSLVGGGDLSLMKGRTEFTVSRILNGRMIYASALGPQSDANKRPLYFYLHSATQCERQIGRAIDRLCQLGNNRLAAAWPCATRSGSQLQRPGPRPPDRNRQRLRPDLEPLTDIGPANKAGPSFIPTLEKEKDMTMLHAQPYDITAVGFYFESAEEYAAKAAALRNDYGQPVEEFEIQFIDGEILDAELFEALSVSQVNYESFFEAVAAWTDDQKIRAIIAIGAVGYSFNLGRDDPNQFDIDLYPIDNLRDLAIQFVDDGLFGDIPTAIANYLDYDAIARDLSVDYGTATVAGTCYAYRAA